MKCSLSILNFSQLLKDKGLLPYLAPQVEDIVFPMDPQLQGPASGIASSLRQKGRSVDLVLENKRLKWLVNFDYFLFRVLYFLLRNLQ